MDWLLYNLMAYRYRLRWWIYKGNRRRRFGWFNFKGIDRGHECQKNQKSTCYDGINVKLLKYGTFKNLYIKNQMNYFSVT